VAIPENVDASHSVILNSRRIFAKKIVGALAISRERIGGIIHDISGMRKLSAKWVPKCLLNADQKRDRVLASQAILGRFRRNPVEFLNRLVTMDKIWIHICVYDPETKEQSKEWKHSGPKNFKTQNSSSKVLASVF
jgi:hypothetical protein